MAEIVYEPLLNDETPLPPGGQVDSTIIDVNGARTVHLVFYIPGLDSDVSWTLSFGPTTNPYTFIDTSSGTFEDDNIVAIALPVFAPSLALRFQNQGTQDEYVSGRIYFIREVP